MIGRMRLILLLFGSSSSYRVNVALVKHNLRRGVTTLAVKRGKRLGLFNYGSVPYCCIVYTYRVSRIMYRLVRITPIVRIMVPHRDSLEFELIAAPYTPRLNPNGSEPLVGESRTRCGIPYC